jgi:hypothetical protein
VSEREVTTQERDLRCAAGRREKLCYPPVPAPPRDGPVVTSRFHASADADADVAEIMDGTHGAQGDDIMTKSLACLAALGTISLSVACGGAPSDDDASSASDLVHAHKITDFTCTAVSSSTTDEQLKHTRLDLTVDLTSTGVPSGNLLAGLDRSLTATSGVGFITTDHHETSVAGHSVTEYGVMDAGPNVFVPGTTEAKLTIPTAYTQLKLESSAALNVATLEFLPSNEKVSFKCKEDKRPRDNGPVAAPAPDFAGAAKTFVAHDACAKTAAQAVMDAFVNVLEDHGVDIPDGFTVTSITRTSSGYTMVMNETSLPVKVGAGCKVGSVDTSALE